MNLEAIKNRADGYKETLAHPGKFDADESASTFRWVIILKNRRRLVGYSKGVDVAESDDKHYVIKSRLLQSVFIYNQYYKKAEKIDCYINVAGKNGDHIFTLFEKEYILHYPDERLDKILKQTYLQIEHGGAKTAVSVFGKTSKKMLKEKNIKNMILNANSLQEYNFYIASLESKNYPIGYINALKREKREKNPEFFNNNPNNNNRKALLSHWSACKENVKRQNAQIYKMLKQIKFVSADQEFLILEADTSETKKTFEETKILKELLQSIAKSFNSRSFKINFLPENVELEG